MMSMEEQEYTPEQLNQAEQRYVVFVSNGIRIDRSRGDAKLSDGWFDIASAKFRSFASQVKSCISGGGV